MKIDASLTYLNIEKKVRIAVVQLNQWALDWEGNLKRTLKSLWKCKSLGCTVRIGPEMELCGYSLEDHQLEYDTYLHSQNMLAEVLRNAPLDMLFDIGMPLLFNGARYNVKAVCLNKRILAFIPKTNMSDEDLFRESRWFIPAREDIDQTVLLPAVIQEVDGQLNCPLSICMVRSKDNVVVAWEICQDLFVPMPPHERLFLQGAHFVCNGSASCWSVRKNQWRVAAYSKASSMSGGCYVQSNLVGGDGGRMVFDGDSAVCMNGKVVSSAERLTFKDVCVVAADINVTEIDHYRLFQISNGRKSSKISTPVRLIDVGISLSNNDIPSQPKVETPQVELDSPQEISRGTALWLWDYLRRSKAAGYFIALSGGLDSASVLLCCTQMCQWVAGEVNSGNEEVRSELSAVLREEVAGKVEWKALAGKLVQTAQMGTEHSSAATLNRAKQLAASVGANFQSQVIDRMVSSAVQAFTDSTSFTPRFTKHGGSYTEDLSLQNIQARSRLNLAQALASLLPTVKGRSGRLLVLATGNVDEALRGQLTKQDCSSGDINPIGSLNKTNLRGFCSQARGHLDLPILDEIISAGPTAELRPIEQLDEVEMGMTQEELSWFGQIRRLKHSGPLTMQTVLCKEWAVWLTPLQVATKVKRFFTYQALNRHKATILPPSLHSEAHNCDDNRNDLRPFLQPMWKTEFSMLDKIATRDQSKIDLSNQTPDKLKPYYDKKEIVNIEGEVYVKAELISSGTHISSKL